jgi:hypothetical protein
MCRIIGFREAESETGITTSLRKSDIKCRATTVPLGKHRLCFA